MSSTRQKAVTIGVIVIGLFLVSGVVGSTGKFLGNGAIEGTVKEINRGGGVEDVNITVELTNYTATTDVKGYYKILNIPAGTYNLTASWIGYPNVSKRNINVTANQTTTVNCDVGILLPGMGNIRGKVSDEKSGNPIKGATVCIGSIEATTDEKGLYILKVPNTPYYGNYHIQASAKSYETSTVYDTGPVGCGVTITMDFVLTPTTPTPGFEAVFAIAGLLAVAYLLRRNG